MNVLLIMIIAGIFFVLIISLWYIATMNDLRRTEIKVEEALSDVDVALIKRHDVMLKMFDISRSYAKYEKEVMIETIRLRSGMSMNERNQAIDALDQANRFINAVAENYPQLRSSENFKQMQISVMDVEEHLQAARRLYNGNISRLNQKIVSFPSSIVASNINMTQKEFLAADEATRQDVKMEL
ncbi:MAG TPA: LemA family protein [Mobilitalea sp.]|nr:LemA family protein [Mobilitalea sp.]